MPNRVKFFGYLSICDYLKLQGQLISESIFGVFKSPKKLTKYLTDFCPSFIGQKSVYNLVAFSGNLKTPKFHSEINLPLTMMLWSLLMSGMSSAHTIVKSFQKLSKLEIMNIVRRL